MRKDSSNDKFHNDSKGEMAMKQVFRMLVLTAFALLCGACSSTFRTMNVAQPIYLSTTKVTTDGKAVPPGTKTSGSVSGTVLYSYIVGATTTTTEEKANADVDFLGCLKTDAGNFVSGLQIEATYYQFFLGGGFKCKIDYTGTCNQLPKSN